MAKVHIHSGQGAVGTGDLQLENGAAMDATLRPVTDAANTASPLELSTGLVAVTSTLQIATNDTEYIDAEDGSGNNRFTVSRASGSQVVNVDYASNPTNATDQVGAIRTYANGASLSDAVSFLRNGKVGIGTNNPGSKLQVNGESGDLGGFYASDTTTGAADTGATILVGGNDGANLRTYAFIAGRKENSTIGNYSAYLSFATRPNGSSTTERMRITSAGNVGIGTNNPDTTLRVKGIGGFLDSSLNDTGVRVGANENYYWQISRENLSFGYLSIIEKDNTTPVERLRFTQATAGSYLRLASGTGGIQFNGDTAAANALDDYEEGDWTPEISFGSGTTGITYTSRGGKYTKIGRQVSVCCYILLSNKGSDVGTARIQGLPYTIGNAAGFYSAASFGALLQITYNGSFQGYGELNTTRIALNDYTEAGVQGDITDADFTNNSQILMQFTYFV